MKNKKILIVDDEAEIAEVLEFYLKKEGFEVRVAVNGIEALGFLNFESFDGVICDLAMPKMDGLTLLKKVRENNDLVPFIYLSGHAEAEKEHEMISYGAYEVVHKPHLHLVSGALKNLLKADVEVKILEGSTKEADEFLEILHSSGKKLVI
jgi:DNA-binding NtrC family response regulator